MPLILNLDQPSSDKKDPAERSEARGKRQGREGKERDEISFSTENMLYSFHALLTLYSTFLRVVKIYIYSILVKKEIK